MIIRYLNYFICAYLPFKSTFQQLYKKEKLLLNVSSEMDIAKFST